MKRLILLILCSCGPDPRVIEVPHCTDPQKAELSQFILDCLEGANPKSDEEPEDWMQICQKMGERAHCGSEMAVSYVRSGSWRVSPCRIAPEHVRHVCDAVPEAPKR